MLKTRHIPIFSLILAATILPAAASAAVFTNPLPASFGFDDLLTRIIFFALGLVGFIALLALVYGGTLLIVGGMRSEQDMARGKEIIFWAIIGVVIIGGAATLMAILRYILNLGSANPSL